MQCDDSISEDSLESKFEADSFKRFELLLKKTENFSHCLSAGDVAAYKGGFISFLKDDLTIFLT